MITNKRPGIYVPTLYFAEGLPYTIVMMMSGIFFKVLGASNVFIGLTSALSLPWILKFLWSPLVDFYFTKKRWIVVAQMVLALLCAVTAGVAMLSSHVPFNALTGLAVGALFVMAIASATHDVSIDGYYLEVLNEEQRAFFVGVRNAAYKVAWLFGSGGLIYLAGKLEPSIGVGASWATAFGICAVALLLCSLFHAWYLPQQAAPAKTTSLEEAAPAHTPAEFASAILTYFQQPRIAAIVFYILVFRLGDALMLKQAPNFLLDPLAKGGLGISTADIGIINGTVGMICLLLGGIAGSWLVAKGGIRKWLLPTAVFQNAAILLYWWLALTKPGIANVYLVNSFEQFAYGVGTAAYTVFLLSTVKSNYKAAHYATATAMMALGLMVPGIISGFLYEALGYANFFLVSFLAAIPGMIAIFYLPIWNQPVADATASTAAESPGGYSSGISKAGQVGRESK